MRQLKWLVPFAVLVLALLGAVVSAQSGDALVRFVHVVPGVEAVDIYVDSELTVSALGGGQATDYLTIPAGSHTVAVTQSGLTTVLWEQEITPAADTASTLVASSIDELVFTVYPDSLAAMDLGKARLTVIHAIADGPTIDALIAGNRSVFPDVAYNSPTGSIDLDLSVEYPMAIVAAGESVESAIIAEELLPLTSGSLFTYVVYGTAARPEKLLLSTPVTPAEGSGFVRVAHIIPDAPEVDVFFNDVRVATRLAYGETTQYFAAPADNHAVSVRLSGAGDEILGANLTLDAGSRLTMIAAGSAESPSLAGISDDFSDIDEDTAVISVLNAVPDSQNAALELADGTELAGGLEFLDTATTSFEPSAEPLAASVEVDGEDVEVDLPETPLHAGVYYTVILFAGEDSAEGLLLDPVSVAQGIGSAPGNETLGQVAEAPTDAPTTEPAVAQPTQSPEVAGAVPTATPVPQVSVTTTGTGVTATVIGLDPTANLRLRQYPNTGSYTLHLAPVGTVLIVNGREGAEIYPETIPTPTLLPESTPFVDPVTLLTGNQDLAPESTWLNVTYVTPDGGSITAWSIATFLDVRDADGERQRLRELPTVPRNQAGGAAGTSITPPPDTEDRVTVIVIGINAGANLNLRRTPTTDGEVLAPVPAGTVLDFLGINEARTWMFVRYISLDGITYTGWANASFLELNFNGQRTTLEFLQGRNLLVITPEDTRGTAEAGAPPVVAATRDPLRNVVVAEVTGVNADANLNLRRTPNVQGEVLTPIPSGSILIVVGRTEDSAWLEVTYEGQNGWVASQFVTLTFNGALVDINTVPISSLRLTPTTAAATPSA